MFLSLSHANTDPQRIKDTSLTKEQAEATFASVVPNVSLFDKIQPKIETVNVVLVRIKRDRDDKQIFSKNQCRLKNGT